MQFKWTHENESFLINCVHAQVLVMIDEDFAHLYPGINFYGAWIKKRTHLFVVCQQDARTPPMKSWEEYVNDDARDLVILTSIPYLLPAAYYKVNKKVWRPSAVECRDGFIQQVSNSTEMEEAIAERKKKYESLGLTFQPTVFAVNATAYYVAFDAILYKLSTIQSAVDTCFKITQVLNLKYSVESTNMWTFLQLEIYNITTVYDKIAPCVALLQKQLKSVEKQ